MTRDDLTGRTARQLVKIEPALRQPARRWLIVGLWIIATVGLHSVLGDPRIAWLNVFIVAVAGLAGGSRFGVWTGIVAALGHTGVDIALELSASDLPGVVARLAGLPAIGLVGAVVTRVQEERDVALFRSATQDSVTGLLNVRAFYEELERLRAEERPYAILLADIAGMRNLNERYGHPTGTEALRALGHVLQRNTKRTDLIARLGSDEVAVALVGADKQGAMSAAQRLAARLTEETFTLPDGQPFEVHAYYGIAAYPDHGSDEVALLREADHAVQDAKKKGPGEIGLPDR
ncbi:MAG: GGDEF domain-containing protein [Nitriliruptorales bacterium]|nr:GGDEF domain-containing protein [Nitriliruptorales bacterium]